MAFRRKDRSTQSSQSLAASSLHSLVSPVTRNFRHNSLGSALATNLKDLLLEKSQLKSILNIAELLISHDIPGPLIPVGCPIYIGEGSQFEVRKQAVMISSSLQKDDHLGFLVVAMKRPKFLVDNEAKLNLADPQVRSNIHDLYLEVLALGLSALNHHANIVNLVGWAYAVDGCHFVPSLCYELAIGDLGTFLGSYNPNLSWEQKYSFCLDIGSGLDAIHDCGIVHGDLKPSNVLIFDQNGLIAKIADFGLAIDENEQETEKFPPLGTPG